MPCPLICRADYHCPFSSKFLFQSTLNFFFQNSLRLLPHKQLILLFYLFIAKPKFNLHVQLISNNQSSFLHTFRNITTSKIILYQNLGHASPLYAKYRAPIVQRHCIGVTDTPNVRRRNLHPTVTIDRHLR